MSVIGRCSAALRGEGNEASLRRDRQIWMCVEHQPEQPVALGSGPALFTK